MKDAFCHIFCKYSNSCFYNKKFFYVHATTNISLVEILSSNELWLLFKEVGMSHCVLHSIQVLSSMWSSSDSWSFSTYARTVHLLPLFLRIAFAIRGSWRPFNSYETFINALVLKDRSMQQVMLSFPLQNSLPLRNSLLFQQIPNLRCTFNAVNNTLEE